MGIPNHYPILQDFYALTASRYNFASQEDCGKFTEDFLMVLLDQTQDYHYCHLRKNPGQTQYNGHAIDVLLYDNRSHNDGTPMMEVDILAGAETSGATPSWQVRETPYTEDDMMQPAELPNQPLPTPPPPLSAYPTYEELGGDALCTELIGIPMQADYEEAKQLMNAGSSVWVNRTVYDAINWVILQRLEAESAYRLSAEKRRPEWRAALGLPSAVPASTTYTATTGVKVAAPELVPLNTPAPARPVNPVPAPPKPHIVNPPKPPVPPVKK